MSSPEEINPKRDMKMFRVRAIELAPEKAVRAWQLRSKEKGTNTLKVKLERAKGECLGARSRRRTRQAAKSCGEEHTSIDPQISEWGNPAEQTSVTV